MVSSHPVTSSPRRRGPVQANGRAQIDAWMGPGLRRDDGVVGSRRIIETFASAIGQVEAAE